MTLSRKSRASSSSGFTMLEIMMVVIIIALLAGAAIHFMGNNVGLAKDVVVKADLQTIETQLNLYEGLNGFYPTTDQGLQALVMRPETDPKPAQWHQGLKSVPMDPWHMPYQYECPGKHNPDSYDLYSCGPDRKAGTADDVGNWDQTQK